MSADRKGTEALGPEGLTTALRACGLTEAAVVGARPIPLRPGQQSRRYRVELTYEANAGRVGPGSMVVKIPSNRRVTLAQDDAAAACRREVAFYRDLAHRLTVRVPRVYAVVGEGGEAALLLEDLSSGRSGASEQCLPLNDAIWAVEQAAALHASSWVGTLIERPTWLGVATIGRTLAASLPSLLPAFTHRFGELLEPEHLATIAALPAAIGAWVATLNEDRCMWHGGFGLDNLLFGAAGGAVPIAVIEWHSVMLGPGIIDVSYFLGESLSPDSRRGVERDLVRHYHDLLRGGGVRDYSWEQCWRDYRIHSVYGLLVSIAAALRAEPSAHSDALSAQRTTRTATQVADSDALRALRLVAG